MLSYLFGTTPTIPTIPTTTTTTTTPTIPTTPKTTTIPTTLTPILDQIKHYNFNSLKKPSFLPAEPDNENEFMKKRDEIYKNGSDRIKQRNSDSDRIDQLAKMYLNSYLKRVQLYKPNTVDIIETLKECSNKFRENKQEHLVKMCNELISTAYETTMS
jgi:hypothetical protein